LFSMPCLVLGSFGVSVCHSVPELLFWRAVQAAGGSAGMSTGMAIIGDIYKLEERGTAMGITFSVRFSQSFQPARTVDGTSSVGSSDRTSSFSVSWRNRHRVRF
jgi:MFS family permease